MSRTHARAEKKAIDSSNDAQVEPASARLVEKVAQHDGDIDVRGRARGKVEVEQRLEDTIGRVSAGVAVEGRREGRTESLDRFSMDDREKALTVMTDRAYDEGVRAKTRRARSDA